MYFYFGALFAAFLLSLDARGEASCSLFSSSLSSSESESKISLPFFE